MVEQSLPDTAAVNGPRVADVPKAGGADALVACRARLTVRQLRDAYSTGGTVIARGAICVRRARLTGHAVTVRARVTGAIGIYLT